MGYGALVISVVDNLLRPVLVGRDTRMPDWLVLFATVGGLTTFGVSGFVAGPVIAALFVVSWQMLSESLGD
jgi:predicted PurR-regulated permease PerM